MLQEVKTAMTISTSLERIRLAGKVCKFGAWIVAIMGLIAIFALYIISNPFSDGSGNGSGINAILINLAIALLMAILILFFCFILYAIGSLLVYLGPESPEKDTRQGFRQESDEFVEIVPIPER